MDFVLSGYPRSHIKIAAAFSWQSFCTDRRILRMRSHFENILSNCLAYAVSDGLSNSLFLHLITIQLCSPKTTVRNIQFVLVKIDDSQKGRRKYGLEASKYSQRYAASRNFFYSFTLMIVISEWHSCFLQPAIFLLNWCYEINPGYLFPNSVVLERLRDTVLTFSCSNYSQKRSKRV